jgi:hypothetical protein
LKSKGATNQNSRWKGATSAPATAGGDKTKERPLNLPRSRPNGNGLAFMHGHHPEAHNYRPACARAGLAAPRRPSLVIQKIHRLRAGGANNWLVHAMGEGLVDIHRASPWLGIADSVRWTTFRHAGPRGEGSIPVPLPPPLHCSPLYPTVRNYRQNNDECDEGCCG